MGSFCALGYGNDDRLKEARDILNNKKTEDGKHSVKGTLIKPCLPEERVGKPSRRVTFYALLAQGERDQP